MKALPIIEVDNLSKFYRIGLAEQRSETLASTVVDLLRSPWRNLRRLRSLTDLTLQDDLDEDVVAALRGVSFSVEQGEVLGIIGANGSGKSTLLKVLGGITEPTDGRAVIRGRMASLLEVGTGFHPELTGRENVYLNGTILGMRKAEIDEKFEEIVAFSGVKRFIDTPVKRYSSGMLVRLGFSVAAHMEPEVMSIDEVLAVGDLEFQKRCIGKMGDVARSGRTILLVSHNMAAIESLCNRALVLKSGTIAFEGSSKEAIRKYSESVGEARDVIDLESHEGRPASIAEPILRQFRILDVFGRPSGAVRMGEDVVFGISMRGSDRLHSPYVGIGINSISGQRLCTFNSRQQQGVPLTLERDAVVTCRWHDCLLLPGSYSIEVWVKDTQETVDVVRDAGKFEVVAADLHGTGRVQARIGVFEGRATWNLGQSRRDVNPQ